MPIHLPPISRRRFLAASVATGAGLITRGWSFGSDVADGATDPNRIALLSDTHIAADVTKVARDINMADHLRQACREIAHLASKPAHVLLNGDFAFNSGESPDYATGVKLLEPIRTTGVPIHIGLGNHDNRERFWEALPKEHRVDAPLKEKHVAMIETPRANWLMLDSLKVTLEIPGVVGPEQLGWLSKTLDSHADKPALVMVHHNPVAETDSKKTGGLLDTAAFARCAQPAQASQGADLRPYPSLVA